MPVLPKTCAEALFELAQTLANETPGFFLTKGPGEGDKASSVFMRELQLRATQAFGADHSEQRICGDNRLAVDFFFPKDASIVEVALSLHNPLSEFEKDILKALMAQEEGYAVTGLVFISKPGASVRCSRPGTKAVISWAERKHNLRVDVWELRNVKAA